MSESLDPVISRMIMDLSDRLATIEGAQLESELVEAERSAIELTDRLVSALCAPIQLGLASGVTISGRLIDISENWLQLSVENGRLSFIARGQIVLVKGLGRASHARREVDLRRGWGYVLRRCGRQGTRVQISATGCEILGRVISVGKDHADIRRDDGAVVAVRLQQLVVVSTHELRDS